MSHFRFFGMLLLCFLFDINITCAETYLQWFLETDIHIANLSISNDGWVQIGNERWLAQKLDDTEADESLGKPLYVLSYHINNKYSRYYGEKASLRIYDIKPLKEKTGMDNGSTYSRISNDLTKDSTSMWYPTHVFFPFVALKTKPRAIFKIHDDHSTEQTFKESIIIMGNERIYYFQITNDQIRENGMQAFEMFDERCLSIAKSLDLKSYYIRSLEKYEQEIEDNKNLRAQEKEDELRVMWIKIIYYSITLCGIIALIFLSKKTRKDNILIRKWLSYIAICTVVFIVGMGVGVFMYPKDPATCGYLFVFYLPAIIINTLLGLFLVRKTTVIDNINSLIPEWLYNNLKITNEYRRRFMMVFLVYPFLIIVPLPVIGLLFIAFYIIPVSLILSVRWIALWIREGMGKNINSLVRNKREQFYCRHCGKLIDADSEYCRYCGKKL